MVSIRELAVLAVCAPLLLGCSGEPQRDSEGGSGAPVVQLGAPGESGRTLSPDELDSIEAPGHAPQDVAFMQAMIPHHRQALEMTAMVEDRAADPQLALLAERIEVSQLDEIAQMEQWLWERGEEVEAEGGHGHHGDQMPGMLTERELARLEAARGRAFDRLFLVSMIRHHEGAVAMVATLLDEGVGAQEPQASQMVQHIDSDQRVEIARMKRMLQTQSR
jgi:uncharacterized protein (DUF305 family)